MVFNTGLSPDGTRCRADCTDSPAGKVRTSLLERHLKTDSWGLMDGLRDEMARRGLHFDRALVFKNQY